MIKKYPCPSAFVQYKRSSSPESALIPPPRRLTILSHCSWDPYRQRWSWNGSRTEVHQNRLWGMALTSGRRYSSSRIEGSNPNRILEDLLALLQRLETRIRTEKRTSQPIIYSVNNIRVAVNEILERNSWPLDLLTKSIDNTEPFLTTIILNQRDP